MEISIPYLDPPPPPVILKDSLNWIIFLIVLKMNGK